MIKTTTQAKPAAGLAYLPPQKATNKRIFEVKGTPEQTGQTETRKDPYQSPPFNPNTPPTDSSIGGNVGLLSKVSQQQTLQPIGNLDKPGFGFNDTNPTMSESAQGSQSEQAAPTQQQAMATTSATASVPASGTGGLMQRAAGTAPINVSTPVKPDAPSIDYKAPEYQPVSGSAGTNVPSMNYQAPAYNPVTTNTPSPTMTAPTTTANGAAYQSDGYTGAQGATNQSYSPGADSLVENRINGLLDPNSALMRKATAQANAYSATRGLQSSSIGGEIALSAMVDKALPIASQDATTANQAQQLGWQQSWQSDQNNLNRTHDSAMADKSGKLQTDLQNSQQQFQSSENNASRAMQAELQQLQYKQSLGMLDAQGSQRMQELGAQQSFQAELADLQYKQNLGQLDAQGAQRMQELGAQQQFQAQLQDLQYKQNLGQLDYQGQQQLQQMERTAQLNQQRDQLLQSFDNEKIDKSFLQQLELTKVQYDQADKTLMAQMSYDTQMQFKNATSSAYNNYMSQVGAIYADPNMTSEQKTAGANYLKSQFESQRAMLESIYGFTGSGTGNTTTPPPTGTSNPNNPIIDTNPPGGTAPPVTGQPKVYGR